MTRKRKALTALAVILALAVAATAYVEFCIHPYLRLAVQSGGVYSTVWSYSLESDGVTLDCYMTESRGQMQVTFFVREDGSRVLHQEGGGGGNEKSAAGIVSLVKESGPYQGVQHRAYALSAQKVTDSTPTYALGTWEDERAETWVLSGEVVHEGERWWIVYGTLDGGTSFSSTDLEDFVVEQSA